MSLYKLTDRDGYTQRGMEHETLWGEGVTHTATGDGEKLCTDGVIHYYDSPEIAALMNPIHADIIDPICWESEGVSVAHDGIKGGCKTFTTVRQVPLPELTLENRVEIAIRVSLIEYTDPHYVAWANKWLSSEDRSAEAAWAAAEAAEAAWAAEVAAWAVRTAVATSRVVAAASRAAVAAAAAARAAKAAAWVAGAAETASRAAEAEAAAAARVVAAAAAARAVEAEFISTEELTNIVREVIYRGGSV